MRPRGYVIPMSVQPPVTYAVNLNPNRLCPDLSSEGLKRGQEAAFRRLADLGAGGVRLDLFWSQLEPAPGHIDVAALAWYQEFLAEAASADIAVYALLYHPPRWAMELLKRDEGAFLDAWRGFCRLVGRELGHGLAIAQVWNEPNNYLAALKGDAALFRTRRIGPVDVPVGVPWELLASLFRIARAELPAEVATAFNPLANLIPFLPVAGSWLDWEPFTARLLTLVGEAIDVVAIDHYPDTWHPGTGPLEWSCLDVARREAADPASPWFGKTVIVGEVGYSSAPNFHLLERPFKLGRFFPEAERDEASMADWYAACLPHVAARFDSGAFPANRFNWINVYELFDPPRPAGGHPALAVEDHFGLVRRDGVPKAAYGVLQALCRGDAVATPALTRRKAPLYWRLGTWARRAEARLRGAEAPAVLLGEPLVLERVIPRA